LKHKYNHNAPIIGRIFVNFTNFAINSEDMFNCIKEYYRRRRVAASACKSSGNFKNLRFVESVSFACCIESEGDISGVMDIHKFLGWKGVRIAGLVVESKKGIFEKSALAGQLQSLDGVTVVPFTDLDWLGDMKEGVATDFFEIKSNLHINFNSTQPFVLQRIAQRVNADMVIGMQNQVNIPFNFIVAGKDGEVLSNIEYLNQIFHYLKIINKDVKDVE